MPARPPRSSEAREGERTHGTLPSLAGSGISSRRSAFWTPSPPRRHRPPCPRGPNTPANGLLRPGRRPGESALPARSSPRGGRRSRDPLMLETPRRLTAVRTGTAPRRHVTLRLKAGALRSFPPSGVERAASLTPSGAVGKAGLELGLGTCSGPSYRPLTCAAQ